jgi:DNA polymerase I-like protein with 3'-5' exonuclease and polymerase domains
MSVFSRIAWRYIIPAATKGGGLRVVFDLEANGLDDATKVHCVVIGNLDSEEITEYGPKQIPEACAHLARANYLTGHNICGYDLPVLRKLCNWAPASGCTIVDTLVASRLILPHVADLDDQAAAMGDRPLGKLRGLYKLEAWGVRLGIPKIGVDIENWSKWTPEMQERCVRDVVICKALWRFLQPDGYSQQALELEHRVAAICNCITADGVPFDKTAAERLHEQWSARRTALATHLGQQFPGTNLNSPMQIGRLLEARGWVPSERTPTGRPKIDDDVLESLPARYPEFEGLAEHHILRRRLGQLVSGKEAWLHHVTSEGRIHGAVIHIGTPHSRGKHRSPNLGQVPSHKKGKPFATECRALFRDANGHVFVTCDQANLQDRGFAHYLAEFDGGLYAQAFIDKVDTHWEKTAIPLGLIPAGTVRDKHNKAHTAIREGAKTFRYAFLFGCGAKRAEQIVTDTARAVQQIEPAYRPSSTDGRQILKWFIAATPGLAQLRAHLKMQVRQHGWLLGLDGRHIPVRALKDALNYLIVCSEAVICKRWLINVYNELHARFRYGRDGDVALVLWIHDELVACCRPEIAEQVGEIMVRYAKEAGEFYRFKVPLDGEFKIGRSWAGEPVENNNTAPTIVSETPEITAAAIIETPETTDESSVGIASTTDEPEQVLDDITAVRGLHAVTDIGQVGPASISTVTDAEATSDVETRPCWSSPIFEEVPPGAEFDVILASLAQEDCVIVRPPAGGNGQDRRVGKSHNGRDRQTEGKIYCPFHDDGTPSLQIYNDEDNPHYHCFGCGAHGPLTDLPQELIAAASSSTPHQQTDNAETLAYALRLWEQAQPIAGTLAARYLAEVRGIDTNALAPNIETVLRFHSACPFNGNRHPCLLALFRDVETNEPAGIHRIALTPDAQKTDRRMLGRWARPRAIKLWPLIRSEVPLYLGEGIETVLAAATRLRDRGRPMWPAWAAASSGNIEKFPIIPGVEELILLVDRDPNGEAVAAVCCRNWKTARRRVRRLRPQDASCNDFNDLVRAKLRVVS